MNRRDFLRLRARGGERVLELSCEQLYMRYVESGTRVMAAAGDSEIEMAWSGEPPTAIAVPTTTELFAEMERRLRDVDVLVVRGRDWLVGDFAREVDVRMRSFVAAGGRVE
jgi:hypothetical protein